MSDASPIVDHPKDDPDDRHATATEFAHTGSEASPQDDSPPHSVTRSSRSTHTDTSPIGQTVTPGVSETQQGQPASRSQATITVSCSDIPAVRNVIWCSHRLVHELSYVDWYHFNRVDTARDKLAQALEALQAGSE